MLINNVRRLVKIVRKRERQFKKVGKKELYEFAIAKVKTSCLFENFFISVYMKLNSKTSSN